GFEALSRGAASVYMIEPDKTQARFLKDNIQLLKAQNCHLINATAQQALPRLKEQFDVVFLDPPYSLNLWQELAHLADIHIKNNGYIYVEADRDLSQLHLPATWQQVKTTKAGTVHAGLYQKVSE
ncbi:RsmD family RNA methyltransferase, partial [Acinetobacter baumannii]